MAEALCGTFFHSVDDKGRMNFPTKLRDILGSEFYLCMGHDDNYIAVYSPEEFEIYQKKLYTIPGKTGSAIRRKLLAYTDKQSPDKQGRIFISSILKEYAGLEKDVVVVGSCNHAEIWKPENWNAFSNSITSEKISEALEELVL